MASTPKEHLKLNKIEKNFAYHSQKISVISNCTKGKAYKTVIEMQKKYTKIEDIVQYLDTTARTNET